MIIVLKENAKIEELSLLNNWLQSQNVNISGFAYEKNHQITISGNTDKINITKLKSFAVVKDVFFVKGSYQKTSRIYKNEYTVINVGEISIGDGSFTVIAGPCTVESGEQLDILLPHIKTSGCHIIRGGAFKPRTSPYSFQGLGNEGLELLLQAKNKFQMPIISEITDASQLPLFKEIDILQIGAKNMQNYELLKSVGRTNKPILLKRGASATVDELLMSAEYILNEGNEKVILCERGIKTFETSTRNTLDLSIVPIIKMRSHLPIIVDPSHATGSSHLIESMSLAALAAGADGIMVEVHPMPITALCDGYQSIDVNQLLSMMTKIKRLKEYI